MKSILVERTGRISSTPLFDPLVTPSGQPRRPPSSPLGDLVAVREALEQEPDAISLLVGVEAVLLDERIVAMVIELLLT